MGIDNVVVNFSSSEVNRRKRRAPASGRADRTAASGGRRRLEAEGIAGLLDRARSGKPRHYTEEFRNQLLAALELPPPRGQAVWDGPALAKHLNASVHAVWRVLRKEGKWRTRRLQRWVAR